MISPQLGLQDAVDVSRPRRYKSGERRALAFVLMGGPGTLVAMASDLLPLSADEFLARVRAGAPTTSDDVSITLDGRRLDSKDVVLAWLAEVEADRAAGRFVELDDD